MTDVVDINLYNYVDTDSGLGSGWKVRSKVYGTSTDQATYPTQADANAATNANSNPVLVNADGRLASPMWFTTANLKLELYDDGDVLRETIPNVINRNLASNTLLSNGSTVQASLDGLGGLLFTGLAAATVGANTKTIITYGHGSTGNGAGRYVKFDLGSTASNQAAVAAHPLFAAETADGYFFWLDGPVITTSHAGWTTSSTSTSTNSQLSAAIEYAIYRGFIFADAGGDKTIKGTITPSADVVWSLCGDWWEFETDDVSNDYTEIQHNPSASGSSYTGSGVYCALDNKNMQGSSIAGPLRLRALGTDGSTLSTFEAASRALVATNLCAFSATSGVSGQQTIEHLDITGFGRGFYQGDFSGSAASILPYTRLKIGFLYIHVVENPLESGAGGNGFDDMLIEVLRFGRVGNSYIRNTELTVGSFYNRGMGLTNGDAETETIWCAAGSKNATVSADISAKLSVGDCIGISKGNGNKTWNTAGDDSFDIQHVTHITAIPTSTTLTLRDAPEKDILQADDATFVINPPAFEIVSGGKVHCAHSYIEDMHACAVKVRNGCHFTSADHKEASGRCASIRNTPILCTETTSFVDIKIHPSAVNSRTIKAHVGVTKLDWPSQSRDSVHNVHVSGFDENYANSAVRSDPITYVTCPQEYLSGGRAEIGTSAFADEQSNLTAKFADGDYRYYDPLAYTGPDTSYNAGTGNNGTRAYKIGETRLAVTGAGSGVATTMLAASHMAPYLKIRVSFSSTNQAGECRVVCNSSGVPTVNIISQSQDGGTADGAWSIDGSNNLVWTAAVSGGTAYDMEYRKYQTHGL